MPAIRTASWPRRAARSGVVITRPTAPSAIIGHSMACSGSQTIFDARICSTVSGLSRYMALGLRLAHLRSATQMPAISSGVEPVSYM